IGRHTSTGLPLGMGMDMLLVLTWLAAAFQRPGQLDWGKVKTDLCLLALLWFIINLLEISNPAGASFAGWLGEMRPITLYWVLTVPLCAVVFSKPRDLRLFLLGIKQKVLGVDAMEQQWLNSGPADTHIIWGKLRVFSFYAEAAQFGASQAHIGLVCLILALGPFIWWKRVLFAMASLTTLYGMLISGTRGAMFVLAAGTLIYLILSKQTKVLVMGLLLASGAFIILKYTYIGNSNSDIVRLRSSLDPQDASFQLRLQNQATLRDYLSTRPFGEGVGSIGNWGQQYNADKFISTIAPDSYYVKLWAEYGIVGFIIWFSMMLFILGKCCGIVWNIQNPQLRQKLLALTAGFGGILVSSYGNENITYPNYEVIVVDNDSATEELLPITTQFSNVRLIRSARNLGFAGGNNAGITIANGEYILFLNNDTEVAQDFLEPLVELFESNPLVGIASPKLIFHGTNNLIQYAGCSGINPWTGRSVTFGLLEKDEGQHNTSALTAQIHGAAMMVPMSLIREVGLMPELYFLYYEELDWCEMIKRAGYKSYYVATSTVYHKESVSVVILQTAPLAQRHTYAGLAQVLVIADGLQSSTVHSLRQQGIEVLEVSFERSTKGKALRAALATPPASAYDVAVVLDVDNIMAPDFLQHINQAFMAGYRVVQGHRTAKNFDSPFAVLDACNEEINNHIYRQGHASLGMSAALIGSGMAFEYRFLHQLLEDIGDTSGEDKEMDFRILKAGLKIGYLPHAYVYDEKIPNAEAFTTQRTRWIAAQIEFLQKYFWEGPYQLIRGNVEFFDKVLQTLLVPRMLLLGLLGTLIVLALLGLPGPSALYWAALLAGTAGALLLSLPAKLYNWQVARALWHLPLALISMVIAL
nr:hypothetical protein [Tanacetum cinerariifolium]